MTMAQFAEAGLVHVMASWPPNAPSTITSCGFLDGSWSARYLKALVMLCVTLSPLAPFLRRVRHAERGQNALPVVRVRAAGGVERNDLLSGDPHAGRLVRGRLGVRAVRIKSPQGVRIGG